MNEPVTVPVDSLRWMTPLMAPSRSSHPARLVGPRVQRVVAFGSQGAEMSVSRVKISGALSMGAHTGSWVALRWPVIVTWVPGGPVAGVSVSVGVVESALAAAGNAITGTAHSIAVAPRMARLGDRMSPPGAAGIGRRPDPARIDGHKPEVLRDDGGQLRLRCVVDGLRFLPRSPGVGRCIKGFGAADPRVGDQVRTRHRSNR